MVYELEKVALQVINLILLLGLFQDFFSVLSKCM